MAKWADYSKVITLAAFVALTVAAILWISAAQRHDAAAGLIEIYENWGTYTLDKPPPEMKPIVLQVPQEYRYGSSKGATRNWGINLITFYPSFTSPQAPENYRFVRGCTGDCNGLMLVAVNNRTHTVQSPSNPDGTSYPNMGDFIAHVRLKNPAPAGGTVTVLATQHGFDRGYQVIVSQGSLGDSTQQFWLHLSEDRVHHDAVAECERNKFAQTCDLHFSLKCNPAIYVQVVGIDMKYVDELLDVIAKTDQFLTPMVREPVCQ